MRRASRRAVLALSVIAIAIHSRAAAPGEPIRNPTTYDVEVQGASSDAAASVELRQAGQDAALTHATDAWPALVVNAEVRNAGEAAAVDVDFTPGDLVPRAR